MTGESVTEAERPGKRFPDPSRVRRVRIDDEPTPQQGRIAREATDDERRRDTWRESDGLPVASVLRSEGMGLPTVAGKHLARGVHSLTDEASAVA